MKVVRINPEEAHKPMCVFGVVDNPDGLQIESRMIAWLSLYYRVVEIRHDGTQYEFPALRFMQLYCTLTGRPCLYIHTRGAFHKWNTTIPSRRMWRHEFGELHDVYERIVDTDKPVAACPFTGASKCTFYNGFMVNAAAMRAIPAIMPNNDRMVYEDIFKDSPVHVYGTIFNDVEYDSLSKARQYLFTNYR